MRFKTKDGTSVTMVGVKKFDKKLRELLQGTRITIERPDGTTTEGMIEELRCPIPTKTGLSIQVKVVYREKRGKQGEVFLNITGDYTYAFRQ